MKKFLIIIALAAVFIVAFGLWASQHNAARAGAQLTHSTKGA
jgi:uncharacterized membrane protein YpjA